MNHINPRDPSLRKLHGIDQGVLEQKYTMSEYEPVSLLRYRHPTGNEVWIVCDGTHRVQAAIDRGLGSIPYVEADERAVRAVAQQRGYNFDDLAQRATRF